MNAVHRYMAISLLGLGAVVASNAWADRGHWHGAGIQQFHRHDLPRWQGGRWHHGRHDGRLGWWWVVGGLWYFYPRPVHPYPDPYVPPVVVAPTPSQPVPAPTQYWYYCEATESYYPYVSQCTAGWKPVPATPSE